MQQLFDTIPKVFRELDKSGKVSEAFVLAAWRKCAGESIAERSRIERLQNKRLLVAVADKVWAGHLASLSPILLARLNGRVGEDTVRFIEFRIDDEGFADADNSQPEVAELEIGSSLASAAERIADEDLRHEFLVTAARYLARQSK